MPTNFGKELTSEELTAVVDYLMTVTGLYSHSRQNQAKAQCDLYFHPVLDRVGMLQWNRFDQIVQRGYTHAKEVIAAMEATTRPRFGMPAQDPGSNVPLTEHLK